jgi:hypothetical protein
MTNPIQPPTDSIQPELNRIQAKRNRLSKLIEHIDSLADKSQNVQTGAQERFKTQSDILLSIDVN